MIKLIKEICDCDVRTDEQKMADILELLNRENVIVSYLYEN